MIKIQRCLTITGNWRIDRSDKAGLPVIDSTDAALYDAINDPDAALNARHLTIDKSNSKMDYDVAIIGAGITGSSLASILCSTPNLRIALIDRSIRSLPGSTGHAPGFVGILNQLPELTYLAKQSVARYGKIPGGFQNVGGLEVDGDVSRAELARQSGLEAEVLSGEAAVEKARDLVRTAKEGVFFPQDGTADARKITHALQDEAEAAGVAMVEGNVERIDVVEGGYSLVMQTNITARHVVLCTNIWSGELAPTIPAIAVAHPYAYSKPHGEVETMPFVRWPSEHVYARDHGKRFGFGSYDHSPVHVTARSCAYGAWMDFEGAMEKGVGFMPDSARALFEGIEGVDKVEDGVRPADVNMDKAYAFNGVFCVTPDGLPLVGRLEREGKTGKWCVLGSWVTHAYGNAEVLASLLEEAEGREADGGEASDESMKRALDPLRFKDFEEAKAAALRSYNDIYNKDK